MGLTSGAFIVLLFAVAAALAAATVFLWPRYAGQGVMPVMRRIGLLLATQIALLMSVLVYVNAYYEFYSGWDDLFGTNGGAANIRHIQARAGRPISPPPAAHMIKTLNGGGGSGALQEFRFQGESTGLTADAYVLLPPQYFQPGYATTKFPVVVVLTGYPGHAYSLIKVMHFPDLVRKGEQSGKVQPTIYVMMRPTLAPPRDTECADVPGGPQVESFFTGDLPTAMAEHYRVATGRTGWGIMGDSTGGYCATMIAMKHVDRYSAAASMSGYFKAAEDVTTGDLFGGSKALKSENDLMWRLGHLPAPPLAVLIASCRIGEKTYPQALRFLAQVRPPMQADSLMLPSGGHNFRTFARMVPSTLVWMSSHLRAG